MRDTNFVIAVLIGLVCLPSHSQAQDPVDTITIDYPDELPLVGLVDYAGKTLGINILYGKELAGKTVVLRPSPITLPRDRLLDLVRSVLRMEGLALAEDEIEGLYRIAHSADLSRLIDDVRGPDQIVQGASGRVVTQVIRVPSGDTKRVATQLKAFTSSAQSSFVEVPESGVILVTDYEPVIARLMRLVEIIDSAPPEIQTRIVPVKRIDIAALADQVRRIGDAHSKQLAETKSVVEVLHDAVPDSLVLIGTDSRLDAAEALVRELDVVTTHVTPSRTYAPRFISAARLKTLVEQLVLNATGGGSGSRMFVDEATNRLYVTATPSVHDRVRAILEDFDSAAPEASRPMRIYRPKNRGAEEILDTLTHLLEEATVTTFSAAPEKNLEQSTQTVGPNRPPPRPATSQVPPMPPAQEPIVDSDEPKAGAKRLEGADYVLTVDTHTNSIIAIGTPEFHVQLRSLIDALDQRRPQVLIEMTLVAISLSDSLDLGFELQKLDLFSMGYDYQLFSSFGLSTLDIVTGQRVLEPGVGANGVLISPEQTPVLFRALATNGKNKVISTPRVLVSNDTTGTIRSVDEAPFTSVNASDTVATTSFAGFESAGTTLTVTPHIGQGAHLTLNYNLTFSNFTGTATGVTAPPPRTTNSFTSEVEVPDGYTVVVGGLVIENDADTVSEVPLLGRIPILGALFQNSSAKRTRSKVFAFIRPVILRDDRFEQLKYITQSQLEKAELANTDFPEDNPMWMR